MTAHPEVFDAADQAAFAELDLFTPALRIVALHATVAVVGVVSLVALLPAVAPGLVRGWTRIVPQGRGVVWRLVRARAASATIANVSSIMTVGLFTGLVVSLSSTFDLGRMVGAVPDVGRASLWSDAATSLGPAAIVAMAGAWATTLLHSPRRDPDSQFLSAHGASSSVITLVTLIQAIVAVLTVAAPVVLLSVGSMTTSLVIAWSTGVAVTPRVPDVVPIVGAIVISFIALAGGARAARWCASAPRTRSATARATARPSRR